MIREATFSLCKKYRYTLFRKWRDGDKYAVFVGLNPSTADETKDDPTVRRCINFCKDWGYGSMYMMNLFAFRATDPKVMKAQADPVGPENETWLNKITWDANITIAAWGVHGTHMNRDQVSLPWLHNLYYLDKTKAGDPRHPLYLKADLCPIPWHGSKQKDL